MTVISVSKTHEMTALEFLERHVLYGGEKCLLWPYYVAPNGYGYFGAKRKIKRANRFMCELAYGPPPTPRHQAAHECGVKACVNPKHLIWKTPEENQADRKRHGTSGNKRGKNQLNRDQVEAIRALAGQRTQQSLADEYGVTRENISQIIRRKTWAA